jgi:hypothetical protein
VIEFQYRLHHVDPEEEKDNKMDIIGFATAKMDLNTTIVSVYFQPNDD